MLFLDRNGWPVERIKGRKIKNFFRLLIHTRRIKKGYWDGHGIATCKEDELINTINAIGDIAIARVNGSWKKWTITGSE